MPFTHDITRLTRITPIPPAQISESAQLSWNFYKLTKVQQELLSHEELVLIEMAENLDDEVLKQNPELFHKIKVLNRFIGSLLQRSPFKTIDDYLPYMFNERIHRFR